MTRSSSIREAETGSGSRAVINAIKVGYCVAQATLPIIASVYLGIHHRVPGIQPRLFAVAAFFACNVILLLQIIFAMHLPNSLSRMLLVALGPPLWLGIQYLWHPFDAGFYIVSAGVSSMLSVAVAFVYFILVRNYFQHPGIILQAISGSVGRGALAVTSVIVLQIVFLVVPFGIVGWHFTTFLVTEYFQRTGVVDTALVMMFVGQHAAQTLVVFEQEGIVRSARR